MIKLLYLGFVLMVGFTNPIYLKNLKKKLDTYSILCVYLVYDN
mgnify:CR=1 FL=1|jgi:hypothetical protein